MGKSGEYECKDCGNQFGASEGRGFFFFEYRCMDCDTIKHVGFRRKSDELPKNQIRNCPTCGGVAIALFGNDNECKCDNKDWQKGLILTFEDEARDIVEDPTGDCPKCGGELRSGLNPMCPECKSRNTENISVDMLYD